VLPTSTRATVNSARSRYYTALGELLRASAARLTGEPAAAEVPELDARMLVVDHRLQQLALVAKPLTRPLVWGNDHRVVRHRLTLFAAVTRQVRELAIGLRRAPGLPPAPHLAAAARALADAALEPGPKTRPAPGVDRALRTADAAMLAARCAPGTVPPAVTRPLLRLRQLLRELAVQGLAPRPRAPPARTSLPRAAVPDLPLPRLPSCRLPARGYPRPGLLACPRRWPGPGDRVLADRAPTGLWPVRLLWRHGVAGASDQDRV
jgi:hypothetical protein